MRVVERLLRGIDLSRHDIGRFERGQSLGAVLIGLTAECGLPKIARATLEAVGYQTRDLVEAMTADSGVAVASLRVDGGMAVSDWTMQFIADILPAIVERANSVETTAWGRLYCWPRARPLSRARGAA
jgi:glycerol kinase